MSTLSEDPVLLVLGTPDLLELIFTHLNPADVKHARLVSRLWSSVIERPKFWRWARISLAKRGQELLSCRILHLVEITVCPEAEESLRRPFITALADETISQIQKVVSQIRVRYKIFCCITYLRLYSRYSKYFLK